MLRTTGVNKNAYARAGWWIAIASSLMLVITGCTASPGDTSAAPVGFAPIHVQGTGSVLMGDSVVNRDGSVLVSGHFGAGTVTLANVEDAPSITSEMPDNIFFLKLDKNGGWDWSTTLSYDDGISFVSSEDAPISGLIAVNKDLYVALVDVPSSGIIEITDPEGNTTTIAPVANDEIGVLILGLEADGSVAWHERVALGRAVFAIGDGNILSLGDGTFLISVGADQDINLQGTEGPLIVELSGEYGMTIVARLNLQGEALWARAVDASEFNEPELGLARGAILAERGDGSLAALLFEGGVGTDPILTTLDLENFAWSDNLYLESLDGETYWDIATAGGLTLLKGAWFEYEELDVLACPAIPALSQDGVFGPFVAAFDGDQSCEWVAQFGSAATEMLARAVVGLENGSSMVYGSRAGSLYLLAQDGSLGQEVTAKDPEATEEAYVAFLDATGVWQGGVTLGGEGLTSLSGLTEGPTGQMFMTGTFDNRIVLGSASPTEFVDSSTEEQGRAGFMVWLDAAGNIIGVE